MDFNEYALDRFVRDRLATARAEAAQRALRPARPRRVRVELGRALIALGQWLVEPAPAPTRTRA
jgi:hypothetical protein